DRCPELPRARLDGYADRVAYSPGVDASAAAFWRKLEDVGAMKLDRIVVGVVVVRAGTDRYVHLFSVERKGDVACPVSASREATSGRQIRHDDLPTILCFEIAVAIGKANHRIGIADIKPLRLASRRIKGHAERLP